MHGYQRAVMRLPIQIREPLMRVDGERQRCVQEIRLRANAPLALSLPEGTVSVCRDGRTTDGASAATVICAPEWVREAFEALCDHALYTHQQELVRGFITTREGVRVGVAGTSVTENGTVASVRDITSLCIRIPRIHRGCAARLCSEICKRGILYSTLLVGAPSTGKTSLLRDAAARLAAENRRVAVVDERMELSFEGALRGCDVLCGMPKATAVEQAVRCLAPDVVVFDELGTADEVSALIQALNSGVAVLGSVHADGIKQLIRRPSARLALQYSVFDLLVFLKVLLYVFSPARKVIDIDAAFGSL